MSKAGQMAQNEGEKDDLKADAIREVLKNPKGAPYMALLRNLRNILLYAPKRRVLEALDKALEYSVMNIPKLEGNCAILIDHSCSVREMIINDLLMKRL